MEAEDVAARDRAYRVEHTLIIPVIGGFLRHEAVVGTLARPHAGGLRRGLEEGAEPKGEVVASRLSSGHRVCRCEAPVK